MNQISRTELIKGNRDLKMELDIAYDKVKLGLSEKSIDLMNIDYQMIFNDSCIKACQGSFKNSRSVTIFEKAKHDNVCHKCYREYLHRHCSKCDRVKNSLNIKIVAEKTIKENMIESFDNTKRLEIEKDLDDILYARFILKKLYVMNSENIQNPNPRLKPEDGHLLSAKKVYARIDSMNREIFQIPTINIIKDNSEIIEGKYSRTIQRTQTIKTISEIKDESEPLINSFNDVFSFNQILNLVQTTNHGLTDNTVMNEQYEKDFIKSQKRKEGIREKKIVAVAELELNNINYNIRKEKLEKFISNDSLLINNSIFSENIIAFFKVANKIQRQSIYESNKELIDFNYELKLINAELRHYASQVTQFAEKRKLELHEKSQLLEETIECIKIGFCN